MPMQPKCVFIFLYIDLFGTKYNVEPFIIPNAFLYSACKVVRCGHINPHVINIQARPILHRKVAMMCFQIYIQCYILSLLMKLLLAI